jgi:homospermidine synthase
MAGKGWHEQQRVKLLVDELTSGVDELGVLVMGHKKGAYWFGSQLSLADARRLCPHNSATTLQVTSSVVAAVCWAIANPRRGIVEPEDMDHDYALRIIRPYVEPVVGVYTDWTPLQHRGELFPEDVDTADPWQFKNFRV